MSNDKIEKVLVTGGKGFVGSHLCKALDQRGAHYRVLDITDGQDLTDPAIFDTLEPVDIVFHLAGKVFVPFGFDEPGAMYRANLTSLINTLDYCRKRNVKRIVFISSYLYGRLDKQPVDESDPLDPLSPYHRSKHLGEQLCQAFYEDFGIVPTIIRPFNIYGPGQQGPFLIPTILNKVIHEPVVELRDLRPKRDFIFVEDAVRAIMQLGMEYSHSSPEIFNLGYGKSISVGEIAKKAVTICGYDKQVVSLHEERPNEILDTVADIRKLSNAIEWQPKFSLDEGLAKTLEYLRR